MSAFQTITDTLNHPAVNNSFTQTVGGAVVATPALSTGQTITNFALAGALSLVTQIVIKVLPLLFSKLLTKNGNQQTNQN